MWGTIVFPGPPSHLVIFNAKEFRSKLSLPSITSRDGFFFLISAFSFGRDNLDLEKPPKTCTKIHDIRVS